MEKGIIKKLPEDHFGEITHEVISYLTNGKCIGVYGLPGYGMDFFARQIKYLVKKNNPETAVIHLNLQFENNKVQVLQRRFSWLINKPEIDEMDIAEYLKNRKVLVILGETHSYKYPKLFRQLYTLHSTNQKNFTILTIANYTLYKHKLKYMENGKLIFSSTELIKNFDKSGVRRIVRINNEEHNWGIPLEMTEKIYELTGGNPALVRALSVAIYEEGEQILDYPQKIIRQQPLNFRLTELANLIPVLSIDEQIHLGLLNENGKIFCKLLEDHLKNEKSEKTYLFSQLTDSEEKLFQVFLDNPGKIINKDQISLILNQTVDSYSEWAIYKAVQRLRNKIEKEGYKISTLKGKGWLLEK